MAVANPEAERPGRLGTDRSVAEEGSRRRVAVAASRSGAAVVPSHRVVGVFPGEAVVRTHRPEECRRLAALFHHRVAEGRRWGVFHRGEAWNHPAVGAGWTRQAEAQDFLPVAVVVANLPAGALCRPVEVAGGCPRRPAEAEEVAAAVAGVAEAVIRHPAEGPARGRERRRVPRR